MLFSIFFSEIINENNNKKTENKYNYQKIISIISEKTYCKLNENVIYLICTLQKLCKQLYRKASISDQDIALCVEKR